MQNQSVIERMRDWLTKPVPAVSLAFFRVSLGIVLFAAVARFILKGWVTRFYVDPTFYFSYYGFEWVKPLPEAGMYAVFAVLALCAMCIAIGYRFRLAAFGFFLLFTYVELLDKANYLNHYYFVSLLTFLIAWLPLHATHSLDSRRAPLVQRVTVPNWMLLAIQLQIGIVYFFGGIAKLNPDWLFRAQPLRIWLSANSGLPVIGPVLDQVWVAYLFSWGAMLFDLSIFFLLRHRRARPWAYAVLLTFHAFTVVFFSIGMFPWIMSVLTLVFFSAEWHEKVLRLLGLSGQSGLVGHGGQTKPVLRWGLAAFFFVQMLLPFRHVLYNSQVWWGEEAFRFSWNIMRIEKTGFVEFTLRDPRSGNSWTVPVEQYLTEVQRTQMSTQPDMILGFAHHVLDQCEREGKHGLEIYAEAYAAVNGRPSALLIDPKLNLAKVSDGFGPKAWVTRYDERSAGL